MLLICKLYMDLYRCCILADREGKAWDFACSIYENLRRRSEKFELNEINIKRFRDDEIKIKIKNNVRRKNCFFIHDSSKKPAEWFLELAFVNEALRYASANEITDVLPYMRFSRQDRKDESRVAVNARALSDVISIHADRILTIDAHSALLPSFYRIPFDNLYSSGLLHEYLKIKHPEILKNSKVMSPDVGGTSRAKAFGLKLGIEDIVIGYKYRKNEGEVNDFKIVGSVKNSDILIIDDMVDSGNTLIKAKKASRDAGAKKVYVYCTHGLFTEGIEKICREVDLMMVTNSISQPNHKKLEVISLDDFFAEAIYRTNEGLSLSELFE